MAGIALQESHFMVSRLLLALSYGTCLIYFKNDSYLHTKLFCVFLHHIPTYDHLIYILNNLKNKSDILYPLTTDCFGNKVEKADVLPSSLVACLTSVTLGDLHTFVSQPSIASG